MDSVIRPLHNWGQVVVVIFHEKRTRKKAASAIMIRTQAKRAWVECVLQYDLHMMFSKWRNTF